MISLSFELQWLHLTNLTFRLETTLCTLSGQVNTFQAVPSTCKYLTHRMNWKGKSFCHPQVT